MQCDFSVSDFWACINRAEASASDIDISVCGISIASRPLGVVGSLATGMTYGAIFGMAPVYASTIGLSIEKVSYFMSAVLLGAWRCSGLWVDCRTLSTAAWSSSS